MFICTRSKNFKFRGRTKEDHNRKTDQRRRNRRLIAHAESQAVDTKREWARELAERKLAELVNKATRPGRIVAMASPDEFMGFIASAGGLTLDPNKARRFGFETRIEPCVIRLRGQCLVRSAHFPITLEIS